MFTITNIRTSILGMLDSWRSRHSKFFGVHVSFIISVLVFFIIIINTSAGTGNDYILTPNVSPTTGVRDED